ncbi:MAG: hypothetical protein AAF206_21520, partial [Bacteroidota bacterium]
DLFANLGTDRIRPFFSRRIGVARDTSTGQNVQNPIDYGVRISGKINDLVRVGFLNMQTAALPDINQPVINNTVGVLQRQVFKRSFVSAFFVNRQNLRNETGEFAIGSPSIYNRVVGLDYNLASADNRWSGKFFYHRSFSDQQEKRPFSQGARISYTVRGYQLSFEQSLVGGGFEAATGFVPRRGFMNVNPEARLFFYPKKGAINLHGPALSYSLITTDSTFSRTDQRIRLRYEINFTNTARLNVNLNQDYTFLFSEFDPSRSGLTPLPEGSAYNYMNVSASYNSDRRKVFNFFTRANAGEYFNGSRYGLSGRLTYRIQPFGTLAIGYDYNQIRLPNLLTGQDTTVNLFLIGPRIELTFTRNIFLSTFIQYNNQLNNLNINTRFQWRYKPVSDFFLVYTDNYSPDGLNLAVRNRAIIAKLTYWLNL